MAVTYEIRRPNGNSNTNWSAYDYATVFAESPTEPTTGDGVYASANNADDNESQRWTVQAPTINLTVPFIELKIYSRQINSLSYTVNLIIDGVALTAQSYTPTGSFAWTTITFDGRVYLNPSSTIIVEFTTPNMGGSDELRVDYFYIRYISSPFYQLVREPTVGNGNGVTGFFGGPSFIWSPVSGAFTANDSSQAQAQVDFSSGARALITTNYGFVVPTGATIEGIKVRVNRRSSTTNCQDWDANGGFVKLTKDGTNVTGTSQHVVLPYWPTTFDYRTYGGYSNLWGATWTTSEINSINFGFFFTCYTATNPSGTEFAYVDHIETTVYYTPGSNFLGETRGSATLSGSATTATYASYYSATITGTLRLSGEANTQDPTRPRHIGSGSVLLAGSARIGKNRWDCIPTGLILIQGGADALIERFKQTGSGSIQIAGSAIAGKSFYIYQPNGQTIRLNGVASQGIIRLYNPTGKLSFTDYTYREYVLKTNPFAYWTLDDLGFGAQNLGTVGAPLVGSYGTAMSWGQPPLLENTTTNDVSALFNRADDYIAIPSNSTLNTGGPYNARTISIWFRTNTTSGNKQMLWEEGGPDRGIRIYIRDGEIYCLAYNVINDDAGATTPWGPAWVNTTVSAGDIHHIALVFFYPEVGQTWGRLKGYLDGAFFGQTGALEDVGLLFGHPENINIAAAGPGGYYNDFEADGASTLHDFFSGYLDEISLWNYAFSDQELYILYRFGYYNYSSTTQLSDSIFSANGSGSIYLSGSSSQGRAFRHTAVGVILFSGSASLNLFVNSNMVLSGSATIRIAYRCLPVAPSTIKLRNRSFDTLVECENAYAFYRLDNLSAVNYGNAGSLLNGTLNNAGNTVQVSALLDESPDTCINFLGIDAFVSIPSNSLHNDDTYFRRKTIELWFKPDASLLQISNSNRFVLYNQGTYLRGITIYMQNSFLYMGAYNRDASVPQGSWLKYHNKRLVDIGTYYVALVLDGDAGTFSTYINSTFDAQTSTGAGYIANHSGSNSGIGASVGGASFNSGISTSGNLGFFNGIVSHVVATNSALTSSKIADRYAEGNNLYYSLLVVDEFQHIASGSIILSGESFVNYGRFTCVPTGGILINGEADILSTHYNFTGIGGLTLSGQADVTGTQSTYFCVAIGSIYLSGQAEVRNQYIASGSIYLSGGASSNIKLSYVGTGVIRSNTLIYGNAIQEGSPEVYWRLNDATNPAVDQMGVHNATYSAGVFNFQIAKLTNDFDSSFVSLSGSTSEHVAVNNTPLINTASSYDYKTIELWFKADSTSGRRVLYEQGGINRGLNIYIRNGQLFFGAWNTSPDGAFTPWGPLFVSTAISVDTVYYAVLVFDFTTGITGYLNGAKVNVSPLGPGGRLYGHGSLIGIGVQRDDGRYSDAVDSQSLAHPFDGIIGEVASYNKVLTESEILSHYVAGQKRYYYTSEGSIVVFGSGSLILSGSASSNVFYRFETSGATLVLSGENGFFYKFISHQPSGSIILSGQASIIGPVVGNGNIILSGSASIYSTHYHYDANGSLYLNGGASSLFTLYYIPQGGLTLNGNAGLSYTLDAVQEFTWDLSGIVESSKSFTWDILPSPLSFYRITGKCLPTTCSPIASPDCEGISTRFFTTILARSLEEICEKLTALGVVGPIASITRFSQNPLGDASDECNIGTEIDINPINACLDYTIDFKLSEDISLNFQVIPNVVGIGGLTLSGNGGFNIFNYYMEPTGTLLLSGEASISHNLKIAKGRGGITLSSATISLSSHMAMIEDISFDMEILRQGQAFISTEASALSASVFDITTSCCSTSISSRLRLTHNLINIIPLNSFLGRNDLVLPKDLSFTYENKFGIWRCNQYFNSSTEKWRIYASFGCVNRFASQDLSGYFWSFDINIGRENLTSGDDFLTRIAILFPDNNLICRLNQRGLFQYDFQVDVRRKLVSPGNFSTKILVDDAGLFGSTYWDSNKLKFEISSSLESLGIISQDLTSFFTIT